MSHLKTVAIDEAAVILNNLNTAVFRTTLDDPGSFIFVNPTFLRIFAYPEDQDISEISVTDLYADASVRASVKDELTTQGSIHKKEIDFVRSTGEAFPGRVSSVLVTRKDGSKVIDGIIEDISEHVRVRSDLEKSRSEIMESEMRYRNLVENSPTGILRIDSEGNILDVNQRMVEILGSPSKTQTKAFNMLSFKPLVDAGISERFRQVLKEGKTVSFTSKYTSYWDQTIYFQVAIAPVFNSENNIVGAQANMEDVTAVHKALEERNALERIHLEERKLFMDGPVMIFKWGTSMSVPLLHASQNVASILGYSAEDFMEGKVLFKDIIHPDDLEWVREHARRAIAKNQESFDTSPYRLKKKSGEYLWVNDHSTIVRDQAGNVKNISGVVYDITKILQADQQIKEREQNYLELFNAIGDAVFIQDRETLQIIDVNKTGLEMYGYTRDEIVGNHVQMFSAETDVAPQVEKLLADVKAKGEKTFEWQAVRKDGTAFWVEIKLRIATINGKQQILANVRDISNRQRITSHLESALKEQEILLREVHHRVKNNMQVIISLLNIQADYTNDEQLTKVFEETKSRIRTMSLVHEKLYKSEHMSSVDFQGYMTSLIFELADMYSIDLNKIKIHQEIENLELNITKANPCGLIVNELVSNAMKYAFPDNREGAIWVTVRREGANRAMIQIRDNGVGMDSAVDFDTAQSMGFRITRILLEQLEGEMDVTHDEGMCFSFHFNLEDDD